MFYAFSKINPPENGIKELVYEDFFYTLALYG